MKERTLRPIPLALTTAIAVASAFLALAVSNGDAAHAHGKHHHATMLRENGARPITRSELAFRNDMRKLWEDHVTWTRLAIVSLVAGSDDTDATVARLLRNQQDIGDAIKPFYGDAAGDRLASLLHDHITIAAALVLAAKAGDGDAVAARQADWEANADDIAAFLHAANPRDWGLAEMKDMLHTHLKLTTDEALARLGGDWDADVKAYDEIHVQALGMADMLSTGIVDQFPRRFGR